MSPTGQRARSADAKDQRRQQLCVAARDLADRGVPLSALTMADVARSAGLAKGTTYLYFSSKEALFLEILIEEIDGWVAELVPGLERLATDRPADLPGALAELLTTTLLARPRMLRLLGELHGLEAGVDVDTARRFKERLAAAILAADAAARALPGFAEGDLARLLLRTHALVVGLAPMSAPAPAVATVLADPALVWMRVDLGPELRGALTDWLRARLADDGGSRVR